MSKVEPYAHVEERIVDTPSVIEVTPGAAIGVTIVAPAGPKLARTTNSQQFLNTFTKDGMVPRNAHISFLNAYYLSFFSELIVARSINSDVKGGLAIYADAIGADATLTGYKIYMKDGVELSQYYAVSFPTLPQTAAMSYAEMADYPDPAKYWGFVLNNVIYYGGDLSVVLNNFKAGDAKVDLSGLEAVACDQLLDFDSSKSYQAQVIDFIVSDINRREEGNAVAASDSIKIYVDEYTTFVCNKVELLNEEGVYELTDVQCTSGFSMGTATPVLPEIEGTRVLTIESKIEGSVDDNPYKVSLGKPYYLTVETEAGQVKALVFSLTIDGDSFLVSFDPNAVDNSGINCYIEGLNTQDNSFNFNFTVADVDGLDTMTWTAFGPVSFGEGFISDDSSRAITSLKAALNALDENEIYDIRYLAPCGITSIPYLKAYSALGFRRKWFAPSDIPFDRTNAKAISTFAAQIQDSYNDMVIGPFDKNTGLTGWMVYIAATTLYYERVMTNRAANMEFAPVYEKSTGVMAYTNPVKLLIKSQREKLLSLAQPVDYCVFDERNNIYYLNDNWTHYSQNENVFGEEMNVRMAHMISLDVQKIMQGFKSKFNNARYRRLVYDSIDNYFRNQLMTQEYKPDDYKITCDESNNTPAVIKARKMKVRVQVRYYNSTKYIDIINEAYAVGGAEFEQ